MPEIADGDLALIHTPIDFLGLNVYSRVVVSAEHYNPQMVGRRRAPPGRQLPRQRHGVLPQVRLRRDLHGQAAIRLRRPDLHHRERRSPTDPHVTDPLDDHERITYVSGFLEWIARAIADGADVRGYYLWSLLDNYEWAAGYTQKFGIIHLDTRDDGADTQGVRALVSRCHRRHADFD